MPYSGEGQQQSTGQALTRPLRRAFELFRGSLSARLALIFGLISAGVVLIMGLGIYVLTTRYLHLQIQRDLNGLAEFYAAYTTSVAHDEASLAALAPQIPGFFASQTDYDVRLFSARSGNLLASTRTLSPWPSTAALTELGRARTALLLLGSYDLRQRIYVARPITARSGTTLAVIEISRDIDDELSLLGVLRLMLIASGGLALLIALLVTLLLVRRMTQPLRQMESATQMIASGDFSRRITITSEDEIGRLAVAINQMASDLSRLEAARRDFIARISHELRTPLTAIKGLVVNLQDTAPSEMLPSLTIVDEQSDRLSRLVNDLLSLSRMQRGELKLRLVKVDLPEIASAAVALVRPKARSLSIDLYLGVTDVLPAIWGDSDRLQQAIVNLVDNALKATPSGGRVEVLVATSGHEIYLVVRDNGHGLTAEEEANAFTAYFRGPAGGAGLGLTIAREIVEAHGGRIWLRNRRDGGVEAGFAVPVTQSHAGSNE